MFGSRFRHGCWVRCWVGFFRAFALGAKANWCRYMTLFKISYMEFSYVYLFTSFPSLHQPSFLLHFNRFIGSLHFISPRHHLTSSFRFSSIQEVTGAETNGRCLDPHSFQHNLELTTLNTECLDHHSPLAGYVSLGLFNLIL